MKKLMLMLLMFVMLPACSALRHDPAQEQVQNEADEAYRKSVSVWKEKNKDKEIRVKKAENNVEVLPLIKGRISKFKTPKHEMTVAELEEEIRFRQYEDKYQRLVENVVVKDQNEDSVTYEYKDARVDELAFLAVQYCKEQDRKTAFLQKVTMYKNRARLATFDCRRL